MPPSFNIFCFIVLIPGDEQAVPNYMKRKSKSHLSPRTKKRRLENVTCGVKAKVMIILNTMIIFNLFKQLLWKSTYQTCNLPNIVT